MDAALAIGVRLLVILLVVIDGSFQHLFHLNLSGGFVVLVDVPVGLVRWSCLNIETIFDRINLRGWLLDHLIFVSIVVVVLFLHQVLELCGEGANHIGLILSRDLFWCSTVDDISVVTDAGEKRAEHDGEVKAVTGLPLVENVGGAGNDSRELVGYFQLLVLQVVGHEAGALLVSIQLCEG